MGCKADRSCTTRSAGLFVRGAVDESIGHLGVPHPGFAVHVLKVSRSGGGDEILLCVAQDALRLPFRQTPTRLAERASKPVRGAKYGKRRFQIGWFCWPRPLALRSAQPLSPSPRNPSTLAPVGVEFAVGVPRGGSFPATCGAKRTPALTLRGSRQR